MAKKILIIEDDDVLRELITKRLVLGGYEVSQAIDGITGLKTAGDQKPDLVLLDILLPGMNGFDVLGKMKKDADLAKIPVIILSNLDSKLDIEKGLQMGAADYLIKINFASEEILEKIEKVLQ